MIMNTTVSIHRFNVEEYHRLIENNILHEDDRVELIEGRIIDMTPIGSKHAACVSRLNEILSEKLQKRAIINIQNPICLTAYTEPEPDIAIIKRRPDFYAEQLPQPEDVLLIIEVSDSSLDYDCETKIPLYAKSNIPEVWLVNLIENNVAIYSGPSSEGYNVITKHRHNQILSPKSFHDITLTVSEIFGLPS
jgi:Uma2 family endonuclease